MLVRCCAGVLVDVSFYCWSLCFGVLLGRLFVACLLVVDLLVGCLMRRRCGCC